jgi:CubicO group peptidase (beta-lactamase class C family)
MKPLLAAVTSLLFATTLQAQASLVVGRPLRARIARGDTSKYRIDADSAFVVRVMVDQISANIGVRILGPKGNAIRGVNAAPRGMERLQVETLEKGAHQVHVIGLDSVAGDIVVTLTAREALSTDPKQFTDQLLAPWDRTDGPGAVVAVWRSGRTLLAKGYGMANLSYDIPFTATTPTNIGSTTKQFTAFAIMLLVDDGKLSLDDDVRKYLPELPDLGKTVTVRNLLTHTTGYREIYNALTIAGRKLSEGDYVSREEMITLIQRQPSLQNAPGAEFNYNNTSYALAAMIVERIAKQSFPEFMAQRVFVPLGMTMTTVRADRHATVRGATVGYSRAPNGDWRALGDLASALGAGGVYTTVGDLQRWVENLANPRVGTKQGIAQMMTPYTLPNGKSTGYGFGLYVDTQGPVKRIQHGGADLSHRSQLAFYPELNAGVTVQSNDGGFDSSIAYRIAKAFFPELTPSVATSAAFDPASYDVKRFDQFVGRYALDAAPQMVLMFSRASDSLIVQPTGQPRVQLSPTSDSGFTLRGLPASLTFHRDAQGKVTGLTWHQGSDQKASPVVGEPQQPWRPTVAELSAYTGRYFSGELETFYDIAEKGGRLVLAQRRLTPAPLVPRTRETFGSTGDFADVTLAFERDRNGQIIAFYASNGRSRDIRFVRVQ